MARSDREFDEGEIRSVEALTLELHEVAEPPDDLTTAMIDALRLIGGGTRRAAAASQLGISESVLEARLASAQERLGAQTTAEALRMAREYRLI